MRWDGVPLRRALADLAQALGVTITVAEWFGDVVNEAAVTLRLRGITARTALTLALCSTDMGGVSWSIRDGAIDVRGCELTEEPRGSFEVRPDAQRFLAADPPSRQSTGS